MEVEKLKSILKEGMLIRKCNGIKLGIYKIYEKKSSCTPDRPCESCEGFIRLRKKENAYTFTQCIDEIYEGKFRLAKNNIRKVK